MRRNRLVSGDTLFMLPAKLTAPVPLGYLPAVATVARSAAIFCEASVAVGDRFACQRRDQREYVWGEPDPKGHRGGEVEQFLADLHNEFETATETTAPKYLMLIEKTINQLLGNKAYSEKSEVYSKVAISLGKVPGLPAGFWCCGSNHEGSIGGAVVREMEPQGYGRSTSLPCNAGT